jgi:hypothetical protein
MMSIEQKVNQHPESSAAGFELALSICGNNHKKVSQIPTAPLTRQVWERISPRVCRFPRSSSRTLAKRFVMPLC